MAILKSNRTKNSTDQSTSRYVQGGITDKFANRVGWWERYTYERRSDDIRYTIQEFQDRRPDLVAKALYGQVGLMWLVLQYNNIVDIETEFRSGTQLTLPSQRRVMIEIMNHQTGGKRVSS